MRAKHHDCNFLHIVVVFVVNNSDQRCLLCQPQECKKLINYDGWKPKRKLFVVKESSLLV